MKLLPSDPDIQTIVSRIKSGDLNLQPDFQRGEVWSDAKKRRLIDSVLRDWHIPPIHVIELADSRKQEVLDGQQRLVAIRDFVDGKITVDGKIEPSNEAISAANLCSYQDLPPNLRRQFDQFTIRVFRLVDYSPEEPGELFFRLNQPVSLTAAEQRNAFFGPVRRQVRDLVEQLPSLGLTEDAIGFSNSRMAYDDTISKLCLCIERRTLEQKLTANAITERYRSNQPFHETVIDLVVRAVQMLAKALLEEPLPLHFNKATFFSWLVFCVRVAVQHNASDLTMKLGDFITNFEFARTRSRRLAGGEVDVTAEKSPARELLDVFNDRASARVSDVISVLTRDIVISWFFVKNVKEDRLHVLKDTRFYPLRQYNLPAEVRQFGPDEAIQIIVATERWGTFP